MTMKIDWEFVFWLFVLCALVAYCECKLTCFAGVIH